MSEYIVSKAYDALEDGCLRHAAQTDADTIKFVVPQVNLVAPVEFANRGNFSIYGMTNNMATAIAGYGLVFRQVEQVLVNGITTREVVDDGIRFDQVGYGRVTHGLHINGIDGSDEVISVVHGCGRIEIDHCMVQNVKKVILLGTGDGQDYLQDKNTLISIHDNLFFGDIERRIPYGTGKILYTGNWSLGWKYQGVQSFGLRLRQGAKCIMDGCIFEQAQGYWDGFPMNQLSGGGANQAVTLEDDAVVCVTPNNQFSPSWLSVANNAPLSIITNDELAQMVRTTTTLTTLKQYLMVNCGPKNV